MHEDTNNSLGAAGIHRALVLEEVRRGRSTGRTLAQLENAFAEWGVRGQVRERLEGLLADGEERGEVMRGAGRRWVALEYTDYYVGTMRVTSRGLGVLRQEEPDAPEIVVAPERLGTAMDGDRVLVHLRTRRSRGRGPAEQYGEVTRVLQRKRSTVVGRFMRDAKAPWVEPLDRRMQIRVEVAPAPADPPRDGEFVEVALTEMPDRGPARGSLLRRFGVMGESGVDEEVVLADRGIPVEFPPEALREAARLPRSVGKRDLAGRTDFRSQPAVTIDGETAKDFDDAVAAFPAADDAIEVFVHIADVAHYVQPGSALDGAARERGTSVYLPGRCVPMLPEELSNRMCSLLPGEDRLAFSVRFLVTRSGALEGYRAERSVFHSRRRCTYTEVFEWLEHGRWPEDVGPETRASLDLLDLAAQRLRARRAGRGSIDFDLPEPEILLDLDGFMTGVQGSERTRAHRLIEDLMIAANECVARLLVFGRQPALFRIHERPPVGKLAELQEILANFELKLRGDLEELPPSELQRLLAAIQGRPEERFLQNLILRSLARAVYHPECRGHYALATDHYLHFTSPIRRYPDLVVHRMLAEMLTAGARRGTARDLLLAELADLGTACSHTERRAEEAERAVVRWKQAEFMRAHLGEEFTGHITGVTAFGVFVQLDQVFVEGLVHVTALGDDYYHYEEAGHRMVGRRTGRVFRLGDAITVRVKAIEEEHMEVRLEPVLPPLEKRRKGEEGEEKRGSRRPSTRRPGAGRPARTSTGRRGRSRR